MKSKPADESKHKEAKVTKVQAKAFDEPKAQPEAPAPRMKRRHAIGVIIAAIIVAAIFLLIAYPNVFTQTVPFSTFKASIQTSPRLSVTATYSNQSQYANESICFTQMIQVISHTRQPSTIDFFIIDKQASQCTYSTTGLGGDANPVTVNSSFCLAKAYGEDGIFLNYSATNYTIITPDRMFVYGNEANLAKCSIAIELN